MAWTELAICSGEMMLASAAVIHHRTQRMARAGLVPNSRDRREFTRMGTEKMDAARESMQAMMLHLQAEAFVQQQRALVQWMRGAPLLGLPSDTMLGSIAALTRKGLHPVHARAVSNAKRLRRR